MAEIMHHALRLAAIAAADALRLQGWSSTASDYVIAGKFGCGASSIRRWRKELGQ